MSSTDATSNLPLSLTWPTAASLLENQLDGRIASAPTRQSAHPMDLTMVTWLSATQQDMLSRCCLNHRSALVGSAFLRPPSFIREEYAAEQELHRLLSSIASDQTAQFILNSEQCQRMWVMGREIFLDSPMHHEYLRICAQCMEDGYSASHGMDVEQPGSFKSVMTSALRLWEMASLDRIASNSFIVKGCRGSGVLVFYLTVVCVASEWC